MSEIAILVWSQESAHAYESQGSDKNVHTSSHCSDGDVCGYEIRKI
jgi:hypothetical protein